MQVLIYTYSTCSFCARAKELLEDADVAYVERPLDGDRRSLEQLKELFGRPAMPYVMIDGEPLGGVDELEHWLDSDEANDSH